MLHFQLKSDIVTPCYTTIAALGLPQFSGFRQHVVYYTPYISVYTVYFIRSYSVYSVLKQ